MPYDYDKYDKPYELPYEYEDYGSLYEHDYSANYGGYDAPDRDYDDNYDDNSQSGDRDPSAASKMTRLETLTYLALLVLELLVYQ